MTSKETAAVRPEPEPLGLASDIPIVCIPGVFTKDERVAQMDLSVAAISRWPLRRQELADGYVFEYEGSEERFLALARWAAGEHRCCPWASYSVEMAPFMDQKPGTIRVRVRAADEGVKFLRTCYRYIETLRDSSPTETPFSPDRTTPITPAEVQRELERCSGC
jgi:hypothetical protein